MFALRSFPFALALLAFAATACVAGEVRIVCRNANGEAVTAAEAYLFQHTGGDDGHYETFGPYESDMRGTVVCPTAVFATDGEGYDRFIYARVPGKLVGVARSAKWRNQKPFNPEGAVTLVPSRSLEGQVAVPAGVDPSKVLVRVDTLHVSTGDDAFDYQSFPRQDSFAGLDTALPEIFDRRPDAKGRIAFNDVPVRGHLYLLARGEGLGEGQWRNDKLLFEAPIAISLDAQATISGTVTSPDGKPAEGIRVNVRRNDIGSGSVFVLSTFRGETDSEGKFSIGGLAEGQVIVFLEDPRNRWTFRPREEIKLSPKDVLSENFAMEEGVIVSGKVTDAKGKPVEAAHISALADSQAAPGLAHSSTDAEGRYRFRLPSGNAQLYFNSLPDGFEYPRPQIVKRLEISAGQSEIADVNFTLQRSPE